MGIVVYAGGPLGAKEGTVGGVGLGFKLLGSCCYVGLIEINPILDPHVDVFSLVRQCGLDVELGVSIGVRDVKDAPCADRIVGGSVRVDCGGSVGGQPFQPDRQLVHVPRGDDRLCQQSLSLLCDSCHRVAYYIGCGLGNVGGWHSLGELE